MSPSTRVSRSTHADNRGRQILAAAASLFARFGYDGTSVRDIAARARIRPASVYYHFPSKADLLVAVLEEGVDVLNRRVRDALAPEHEPWRRLEAACVAHMETLLEGNDYVRVLSAEIPARRAETLRGQLVVHRDRYEDVFRNLVNDLPVAPHVDRKVLRLTLLGAIAWSMFWYQPDGDSPTEIARQMVRLIREPVEAGRP
ncbi:MAG TPA: TetR/AcrR family transcriptional regulator [Gammaproteobacteria bacterium]|nr:TetR/AcrR family transcriptional regulator [Gammaproteobacteria bacterium]